ncbi:MAG: rRNA (cytosine967-C5)-methyltransferase [Pyrinomonadaceae bacterium]|jgi:16S rRNA (cytosine967-C5)-methyltransferase|nr:rRNA (cytosine967-C5)-methyltransferase [Pyrinomonadaceae bacterium]
MAMRGSKKNGGASKREGGAGRRVSDSRRAAAEILRRVEDDGAFAAVLLASVGEELRADDRALCYELVLGVLRRQLWLDKLIAHYAGRDAAGLDAPVRRALRLGLYQLRFLTRIPASAAVNESVNLAHEARLRSAGNFINAVLRRATREPDYDPAADSPNELERLAISTSHPAWLVERWVSLFGAVEAESFARANNRTPPVAFRVNPSRVSVDEVIARLRAAGVEVRPSVVAAGAWRVESGGAAATQLRALAAEGAIYTQDEASQLVAQVVGARGGERVLDVCAAPGSKTTQIAAQSPGALVVAGDLYGHRLRVVRESAARQGLENILTVAYDAEALPLPFAAGAFRRVLVDAPCTGTGTLRHNPEIRWRITPADVVELAARQRRILDRAAHAVGRGGRLVYSTCSVEPEENEEVVAAFLATHPAFELTRPDVPERLLTETGAARTWPQRDDTDGFFVAAFEKMEGKR